MAAPTEMRFLVKAGCQVECPFILCCLLAPREPLVLGRVEELPGAGLGGHWRRPLANSQQGTENWDPWSLPWKEPQAANRHLNRTRNGYHAMMWSFQMPITLCQSCPAARDRCQAQHQLSCLWAPELPNQDTVHVCCFKSLHFYANRWN